MHHDRLPAPRACPLFLFGANELTDAILPDALKVGKHAHPIPAPITFIQILQSFTGVCIAGEAVLEAALCQFFTVVDDAGLT